MNGESLILMPGYLEKFLDGSAYGETPMNLTREEYDAYTSIDIEGLDYDEIFEKIPRGNENDYASISLTEDGLSNLAREYFMAINLERGFEKLPRNLRNGNLFINNIAGVLELVGNLSKFDIMKEALLSEDGIELVNRDFLLDKDVYIYKNLFLDGENHLSKYFWEIRMWTLSIIQDRTYSLEERLIFLGIAYEHLDLLNEEKSVDLVPEKLEDLSEIFKSPEMRIFCCSLKSNEYLSVDLIEELLTWEVQSDLSNRELEDGLEFLEGFAWRENLKYMGDIVRENRERMEKYLKDREYLLENYIFNHIFKELIPFDRASLKLSYLSLISTYLMLEFVLMGIAGREGELSDQFVIRGLANFQGLEKAYVERIVAYLVENEFISMEHIILFLDGGGK